MYCKTCGYSVNDDDSYCPNCGTPLKSSYSRDTARSDYDGETRRTLGTIALVFAIISCVAFGFALFPLAWMIPMTVYMSRKLNAREPMSIAFKVCTLIFLNTVSGILLLCMNDGNSIV